MPSIAPLIIAGVAVLAVGAYMVYAKNEEDKNYENLKQNVSRMSPRQQEFATCIDICKKTFSLPGERDTLNMCVVKCNY